MLNVMLTRTFNVTMIEDLESHLDQVMDAMLALENESLVDSDLSATLATGEVTLSIIGRSSEEDESLAFVEAITLADSALRSAIHAAGGHTPEWVPVSRHAESLVDA